jgi:hypothetical protein
MGKKWNCWSLVSSIQLLHLLCSASPVWAYTDEDYLAPKDQVTCEYDNAVSASAVFTSTCQEHESYLTQERCRTDRWDIWCTGSRSGRLISATGCPPGYKTTRPQGDNPCQHRIATTTVHFGDFETRDDCEAARAAFDCKTQLLTFQPDGDGSTTHVVQTEFDCIREKIPTPGAGAAGTTRPDSGVTVVPYTRQ